MIRLAAHADVPAIVGLVRELATYERAAHEVMLTEALLDAALFAENPAVFCHVVEDDDGEIVGMALWFLTFSTWLGAHGIYLEDLYVKPECRARGYGKALLQTLARTAVDRGYQRLEWAVLDWNEPALGFYRSLGAVGMDEWTVHRVTGPALHDLAGQR